MLPASVLRVQAMPTQHLILHSPSQSAFCRAALWSMRHMLKASKTSSRLSPPAARSGSQQLKEHKVQHSACQQGKLLSVPCKVRLAAHQHSLCHSTVSHAASELSFCSRTFCSSGSPIKQPCLHQFASCAGIFSSFCCCRQAATTALRSRCAGALHRHHHHADPPR